MKVAWLVHQGEELNWSSALRLRRLDIYRYFREHRWAHVEFIRGYLGEPFEEMLSRLSSFDVLIFGEQSEYDYRLMLELKKQGRPPVIIRDHCENIWDFPMEMECFRESTVVVCSSQALSRTGTERGLRTHVIPEHYDFCPYDPHSMLAGYMGTDGSLAYQIGLLAEAYGWRVEILCRPEERVPDSITWEESSWRSHFSRYSLLLAPQRDMFPAKSPAKVVQALGNGMPVIASRIESYRDLVQHGRNGLLCGSLAEWDRAFRQVSDGDFLEYLREGAQKSPVREQYSLRAVAGQWRDLLWTLRWEAKP